MNPEPMSPAAPMASPALTPRRSMLLGLRSRFGGGSVVPGIPSGIPAGTANPLQPTQFGSMMTGTAPATGVSSMGSAVGGMSSGPIA